MKSPKQKPAPKPAPKPENIPWGVERVNAPAAWPKTTGAGVRVAVIDSGVDCTHPAIACSRGSDGKLDGYNYVDPSQPPMDELGHGTHVAGIIAARLGGAVVGVAPGAQIVPVKVLDGKGNGRLSSVIKGILWVARHQAPVANMSLGSPVPSVFLHGAVWYARRQGVTIVAAAGNSGPGENTVNYPGAYPQVIAVSASGRVFAGGRWEDRIAPFSSRGPEVDFIAPGVEIPSTLPGGAVGALSGTSMASPHVAGLAALAVALGAKGPDGVFAALKGAAVRLNALGDPDQGAGMVDAARLAGR